MINLKSQMAVLNNKSRRSMLTDRAAQESRTLPYLSNSIEIVPKETTTEKLLVVHRHLDILKKKQEND